MIVRPGPYICSEWEYGGENHAVTSFFKTTVKTTEGPTMISILGNFPADLRSVDSTADSH